MEIGNFVPQQCRGDLSQITDHAGYIAQPKYDGMRVCIFRQGDETFAITRNLKTLNAKSLSFIIDELQRVFDLDRFVIDGELTASDRFTAIGLAKRHEEISDIEKQKLRFNVFDILSQSVFTGSESEPQADRLRTLEIDMRGWKLKYVVQSPVYTFADNESLLKCYKEALWNGYEGLVVKDLTSRYTFGDATHWIKMKMEESEDDEIVEILPGKKSNMGVAGALLVRRANGVQVHVGTGLTAKVRKYLWDNRKELVGKICEMKHNGETPKGSVSHATYIGVRWDK